MRQVSVKTGFTSTRTRNLGAFSLVNEGEVQKQARFFGGVKLSRVLHLTSYEAVVRFFSAMRGVTAVEEGCICTGRARWRILFGKEPLSHKTLEQLVKDVRRSRIQRSAETKTRLRKLDIDLAAISMGADK